MNRQKCKDGYVMFDFSNNNFGNFGDIDWIDSDNTRDRHEYPYSYSAYYIWRVGSVKHKDGVDCVYDDRMRQWDSKKYEKALIPNKRFPEYTPKDASKFLTEYFGKPIEATALAEGCNVGNGYPYWIFYYKDAETK